MDEQQFDRWTRMLAATASRRVARRTLVGSTIAAGLGRLGVDQAAATKKKRKKLKKNAYGCVNVGGKCGGRDSHCCSGICKGKKPKKGKKDKSKCRAHNVLDCPAGADACSQSASSCGTQNGVCNQTTGQASFCAAGGNCKPCKKDADCEPTHGPGAACAVCPSCPAPGTVCLSAAV